MEMGMAHDDVFFVPLPPVRRCACPGCRTVLAQSNKAEVCYRHLEAERQYDRVADGVELPKLKRICSHKGCYVRLPRGNSSGYCIDHAVAVNE